MNSFIPSICLFLFVQSALAGGVSWSLSKDRKTITVKGETLALTLTEKLVAEPGTRYYLAEKGSYCAGLFAVHIPANYDGRTALPLVVSSHGNGGCGAGDIRGWRGYADRIGFIAVCPSFGAACAVNDSGVDDVVLKEIMERVFKSLKIDRRYVLGTGHSGGGIPTWNNMMKYPDWFTALCFRGANCYGSLPSPAPFRDRPVYVVWGEKDNPLIFVKPWSGEGPKGMDIWLAAKKLQSAFRTRPDPYSFEDKQGLLKWDEVPGAGHIGFTDRAAAWFAQTVLGRKPDAKQPQAADNMEPAVETEEQADPPETPAEPVPPPFFNH